MKELTNIEHIINDKKLDIQSRAEIQCVLTILLSVNEYLISTKGEWNYEELKNKIISQLSKK